MESERGWKRDREEREESNGKVETVEVKEKEMIKEKEWEDDL